MYRSDKSYGKYIFNNTIILIILSFFLIKPNDNPVGYIIATSLLLIAGIYFLAKKYVYAIVTKKECIYIYYYLFFLKMRVIIDAKHVDFSIKKEVGNRSLKKYYVLTVKDKNTVKFRIETKQGYTKGEFDEIISFYGRNP